eukprot:8672980-Pyramimonas_sp.AAC.1
MTCRHPDVAEYYTAKHNAAGRQIMHFLKKGGLGRFAILTNFGRIDGDPEQPRRYQTGCWGKRGGEGYWRDPKGTEG